MIKGRWPGWVVSWVPALRCEHACKPRSVVQQPHVLHILQNVYILHVTCTTEHVHVLHVVPVPQNMCMMHVLHVLQVLQNICICEGTGRVPDTVFP